MQASESNPDGMIEWQCDACDRSFPVDPHADRVPCPYCGDINRISRGGGETPASSPEQTSSTADPSEQLLRMVRPALVRGQPLASLGSMGLLLGGLTMLILSFTGGLPDWLRWPGGVAALIGVGWGLWIFVLGHRWDRLKITDHRTIDERGIVVRSTSEVLHSHVRNIRITQSVWQRIARIGTLEIDSAAGDGTADIQIVNIPDPDGIKRLIDRHRGLGNHD